VRDYISIGPSPVEEDCAQVGSDGYHNQARKECRAFINQLRRQFCPEIGSANLNIKANPHDFGTYYDVVCYYDDDDQVGSEYAFKLEDETPEKWDAEARVELGLEAAGVWYLIMTNEISLTYASQGLENKLQFCFGPFQSKRECEEYAAQVNQNDPSITMSFAKLVTD
jgi:hypothetical protein